MITTLPTGHGVYQFKDALGTLLYVGKARNIRSRVRSHFGKREQLEGRHRVLYRKTADVEVIVTDTEAEALILENNLIKQHQPRYNINLRDDKSYPYICVKNEPFPRVFPTRRLVKDGSKYFGPYTDVGSMRRALKAVHRIFKLRTCTLDLNPKRIAAGRYETCLEYHIKNCAGPCVGYQTREDYDHTIKRVEAFLNGKTSTLVKTLEDAMRRAAAALRFEEAATLRNQITAIKDYAEKQKVVTSESVDRDLFAVATHREENVAAAVLFRVRDGKIIGRQHKILSGIDGHSEAELMQTYLERYYTEAVFIPDEVFLSSETASPAALESYLAERCGNKVLIKMPQRGEKAALMRMVEANAQLIVEEWIRQLIKRGEDRIPYAVKALQADLGVPHLPRRIECFDISHLAGTGTVASCVVFVNGKPRTSEYRGYRIRSLPEGRSDDYQAMHEVVTRRYKRVAHGESPLPDLVIIDGGKGQLSSAMRALEDVQVLGKFPVVGLAKRLEAVFFPGDKDPTYLSKQSVSLQLIQRARDEAHRFAVNLQRKQHRKKTLHSELLNIPQIGPKRAQRLIRKFGSVHKVKQASVEALGEVVGSNAAEAICQYVAQQGRS